MGEFTFDFQAPAVALPPLNADELCGARTRAGHPCRGIPMRRPDRVLSIGGIPVHLPQCGRCRMHGGGSTGPKTPEGKAAIAASNRRRARRLHNS